MLIEQPSEDWQGIVHHGIAASEREADVARQPHDLSGHHHHLLLLELLGKVEATQAPRTSQHHVESALGWVGGSEGLDDFFTKVSSAQGCLLIQSNPLYGSTDNGSIRLLVQVVNGSIRLLVQNFAAIKAEPLKGLSGGDTPENSPNCYCNKWNASLCLSIR